MEEETRLKIKEKLKEHYKKDINPIIDKKLTQFIRGTFYRCSTTINSSSIIYSQLNYDNKILIKHLESQFKEGMTWDNYGSYWNIDHKTPVSYYYRNRLSPILALSLSNLCPLEKKQNIKKGGYNEPFLPKSNM